MTSWQWAREQTDWRSHRRACHRGCDHRAQATLCPEADQPVPKDSRALGNAKQPATARVAGFEFVVQSTDSRPSRALRPPQPGLARSSSRETCAVADGGCHRGRLSSPPAQCAAARRPPCGVAMRTPGNRCQRWTMERFLRCHRPRLSGSPARSRCRLRTRPRDHRPGPRTVQISCPPPDRTPTRIVMRQRAATLSSRLLH